MFSQSQKRHTKLYFFVHVIFVYFFGNEYIIIILAVSFLTILLTIS